MRLRTLLIAFASIAAARVSLPAALQDTVKLDAGAVAAAPGSASGVRAFKGIPFAAPPVGELRWRPPQPPAHWDGIRNADQFGPRCMQGGGPAGQPMSEDCLTVNVWTAANSATERRPVMVWSYGGAFANGAGSQPAYDGEMLARKGVVVVTYNYRLGPFGWFSHPELSKESGHRASGNYGVMDALAVLQWVQRNIAAFGGDPQRVTVFGESAGGALIATLVGLPEGRGLFQRAISESASWMGTRIAPMLSLAEAEEQGKQQAAAMGASSLAELRAKPAEDVQKALRGTRPTIDGWLIPQDSSTAFSLGRQKDVDVLLGLNKDEGGFPFFGIPRGTSQDFIRESRERFGDLADSFLARYPAGSDVESDASQLASFRDELSWQMREWAALQARRGKSKAYVYYFTREAPVPEGQRNRGAIHTAEIPYVFNNLTAGRPWIDVDRALAETMSSYWVNFAGNGDPNGPGLPAWPAYRNEQSGRAMLLGDRVEPESAADPARFAVYDGLFENQLKARRPTRLNRTIE